MRGKPAALFTPCCAIQLHLLANFAWVYQGSSHVEDLIDFPGGNIELALPKALELGFGKGVRTIKEFYAFI